MKKLFTNKRKSGQTLIIVLVIMMISLAVGLAVSTRATSSMRRVTQTYQSAQALAFAESGVETALAQDLSTLLGEAHKVDVDGDGVDTDCSYTVSTAGETGKFASFLNRDLVQQVDLDPDSSGGTVYWGTASEEENGDVAALVITLVYKDSDDNYGIVKYAVDSEAARRAINGFASPDSGGVEDGGVTYARGQTFNKPDGTTPIALRVRSMYNVGAVSFLVTSEGLPSQGYRIISTGIKGTSERKVEVVASQPAAPSMFDYVLFSGGNLQK